MLPTSACTTVFWKSSERSCFSCSGLLTKPISIEDGRHVRADEDAQRRLLEGTRIDRHAFPERRLDDLRERGRFIDVARLRHFPRA